MKLYFSPGACSLSPHIVLCEAGLRYELEKVDLASKMTASGADFRAVNPKGYVPALQLDDGEVLTEVPAIVQYLADRVPEKELAPAAGSIERYRAMEWLNFISTELHKNYSPLFQQNTPEETRQQAHQTLGKRLELVAQRLQASPYLSGDRFGIADTYLFTVLRWSHYVKLDLDRWPQFQGYMQRMKDRPAVHRAMLEEGLIKA